MGVTWSQFFPPPPSLTETNLPSPAGKVFIVTGGYNGVGFELCKILYKAGGRVYIAGRSKEKALHAIERIKAISESSAAGADIIFLFLSLDDLTTIKRAVQQFTSAESRLDILFNNAGISNPPRGSVSPQGHDLQLATNCLGPHLLTQLLLPILLHTAKSIPPAGVRVIWTGSLVVDISAPVGGMEISELLRKETDPARNYINTKVGNWFLAKALADQVGASGILSVVQNPGNLRTDIARHFSVILRCLVAPLAYHAKFGAYTSLWAAFSHELNIADGGSYIIPWGRFHPCPRDDLLRAMETKQQGGTGSADTFVQYCDDQIADYLA